MNLKSFSDSSVVHNYVCVNWKQINTCVIPRNDAFGYNSKSELASATLGNNNSAVGDFVPEYDADGNATLIKTATGIWSVSYNAENRPVRFECAGTQTIVEMNYDYLGRRFEKKITVAGTTTLHHRYIYRGFLQIACLDLTRAGTPALWFVFWDPTQPTATRPLAIQKDGSWFVYGHDLTKNVCEVFGPAGYIRTEYSYSPFGAVTSVGDFEQPFQWSSEFYDSELDLVYYNYRHYSPSLGRWLSRDPIEEQGGLNLYCFLVNNPILYFDYLGKSMIAPGARDRDPKSDEVDREWKYKAAIKELLSAYNDMKEANVKGGDKYFHCIGMCNATRRAGRNFVDFIARSKEIYDLIKTAISKGLGNPLIEKAKDSLEDMVANRIGINCSEEKTCEECCCEFKVPGIK